VWLCAAVIYVYWAYEGCVGRRFFDAAVGPWGRGGWGGVGGLAAESSPHSTPRNVSTIHNAV